ncbi:mitochondrial GTPase 1 [Diutina catenulata]
MSFLPRRVFPNYNLPLANFKGHHAKALTRLGHLAPQIDIVLEIRDSRAPLSTKNALFDRVLAHKDRLVVYTKKDLVSGLRSKAWTQDDHLFIDARSRADTRRIINRLTERYDAMDPPPPLGLRALIVGMPNVGKSTFVNTLREVGYGRDLAQQGISSKKRKVAKTGGQPGVTRATSEIIRVSKNPDVLVYDTPGVFLPTVKDSETMLSLGLVGCVPSSFIDPVIQADYLLYVLNLQDPSGAPYREYLDHPTNNIDELLMAISKARGHRGYDEMGTAAHWVAQWTQGKTKTRALFDVGAIENRTTEEIRAEQKAEAERVREMGVAERLAQSLGEDGTGSAKNRKRTAKDREFDQRNQLFKL